jgi:molybdopterin converting factor small subunit
MESGEGRPVSTIMGGVSGPPTAVSVNVELFGVPRLLAGARSLPAAGRTLGEVAADLGARCPALIGKVIDGESGWLLGGYTFVVDERFTRDPTCRLTAVSSVLLVSSVAGG